MILDSPLHDPRKHGKDDGKNDGEALGNELSPTICMHAPNLTLVMLEATLAHLAPT
jgi:hypothetical protein